MIDYILNIPLPFLILSVYLLAVSLFAIIITAVDKMQARRGGWRVPEKTLLGISAFGGSVAMLITMFVIRHKTKKPKFMIGIPLIIVIQAAMAASLIYFFA